MQTHTYQTDGTETEGQDNGHGRDGDEDGDDDDDDGDGDGGSTVDGDCYQWFDGHLRKLLWPPGNLGVGKLRGGGAWVKAND